MSLTKKQLSKLVSGNTVYRVNIHESKVDVLRREVQWLFYDHVIEKRTLCGKKILHTFHDGLQSLRIVAKERPELSTKAQLVRRSRFLSDLEGTACFDTMRTRFMKWCNTGWAAVTRG